MGNLRIVLANNAAVMAFSTQPILILPTPQPGMPFATANTNVNVRSGPSTNYPVLGVAQAGASGEISGKRQDGSWWQVRVPLSVSPDGLAWVLAAYVSATNAGQVPVVVATAPPPEIKPPSPPTGQLVITAESLNVRAGPGNEYPSLGKIPAGTVLQVTGQSGNWLSVAIPTVPGEVGWISGIYVVPYTGPIAVPYTQ